MLGLGGFELNFNALGNSEKKRDIFFPAQLSLPGYFMNVFEEMFKHFSPILIFAFRTRTLEKMQ